MKEFLGKAAAQRMRGERPSPIRALGVAIVTGAAAGVIAYKAMRSAE